MKNIGGFSRLSLSFAIASWTILVIGVGLFAGGFTYFLAGLAFPEAANQSKQLTFVFLDFVLKFLLDIKLGIYAFLLMGVFSWLSWIFAGFAKNE